MRASSVKKTDVLEVGLIALVGEEPKEISGVFGVPKHNGAKKRPILDARNKNTIR